MSKAFVKDDADAEALAEIDPADLVPAGAVNYLTQAGHRRFSDELTELNQRPAPRAPEDDRRRRFLTRLLEISTPIDPASLSGAQARLGATVDVLDEEGRERRYQIVGIHEADASLGRISWNSPLGRILLGAVEGDVRTLRGPRGEEELEVVRVSFESVDV